MARDLYLSARQAAEELGVSAATLYAYVSRGLIRSEPVDGNTKTRRYHHEDVERLKERKEVRRDPTKLAQKALHWGAPVLDSSITLIADGRLSYRGYDAVALATTRSVEEIAALIWLGDLEADISTIFGATQKKISSRCLAVRRRVSDLVSDLSPIELFQALLPVAAAGDIAAYDLHPVAVAQTGARILRLLAFVATGREADGLTIAQSLQEGWTPRDPAAAHLFRTALILCADHELNVSTFTARCVASAGSTPYGVVIAGLTALQGAKHGGYTDQVEAFLREVDTSQRASTVIANRLKRGERLPGFGHQMYPDGDPRGKALLDLTMKTYPDSSAVTLGNAVVKQVRRLIGQQPTIDFALAVLAGAVNLPPGGALALFALGRTIGWIGHAIEQYQLDQLIRPRARYIGPASHERSSSQGRND
jgi:citrate synthase